jgi:hypothetical protein
MDLPRYKAMTKVIFCNLVRIQIRSECARMVQNVFPKRSFLALYNHDRVLQRKDRCFTDVDVEFHHTLNAPDRVGCK